MRIQNTATDTPRVTLTRGDREKLSKVLALFGPRVELEKLGRYEHFSDEQWWQLFVGQFAVMGGSRGWDGARRVPEFQQAIALDRCLAAPSPTDHLAAALRDHGATRFWQKTADKLGVLVRDPRVVRGDRLVLCEGLRHGSPAHELREALLSRCPRFKLKSASDFLIGVGLSHDLIAFDVRVVGALREGFGLEATAGQVQGNRPLYLALEATLREACAEARQPLALLDRVFYKFRGTPELKAAVG
jgi:thermostable 8-oxoguanine DNA glycosylase